MAEKTLKYRDLLKRLKLFGVVEIKNRGAGSERLLKRIVGGVELSTTTRCHNEGDQNPKGVIAAIRRRRLKLDEKSGVSNKDFYGK